MENNILGVIKYVRKQKKITQEAIAKKLGMKTSSYGDIENGTTRMKLDDFLIICKFLEIDPINLVKDSNQVIVTLTNDEVALIDSLNKKIQVQRNNQNFNIYDFTINGDFNFGDVTKIEKWTKNFENFPKKKRAGKNCYQFFKVQHPHEKC